MTSEKQADEDNETATSSTEKTDEHEHEEVKSKSSNNSDNDDDETSSNASSEYEVEKILAKRRRRRGGFEYYIKWVGYDDSANEWIPAASLNCPERLAEFERDEERKRKRLQKEKVQTKKRRRGRLPKINKTPVKRRRVKVLQHEDDDEEEEDDDDGEDIDDEPMKSVESSHSSSTKSDKDRTIIYGVEKGYKVQAILGINRTKSDQLHYLVHYKSPTIFEDNMELIPANIAKKFCEDELIQFYETRIAWNNQHDDL